MASSGLSGARRACAGVMSPGDGWGRTRASRAAIGQAVPGAADATRRGIRKTRGLDRPIRGRTAVPGPFDRAPEADGGLSRATTGLVEALKPGVTQRRVTRKDGSGREP